MKHAYRQPPSAAEIHRAAEFYADGRRGGTFDSGIQAALERILASPKFLFRAEREPKSAAPGSIYPISGVELASRLSFFLWSSIPDDELLDLASQGKLQDEATFDREVRRMLADPRAEALVTNFAGQWLQLRNLNNVPAKHRHLPRLRRQSAPGDSGARPNCSSRAWCEKTAACWT